MTSQEKNSRERLEVEVNGKKAPYKTPELISHGKVEKLTLATGAPIPGREDKRFH